MCIYNLASAKEALADCVCANRQQFVLKQPVFGVLVILVLTYLDYGNWYFDCVTV